MCGVIIDQYFLWGMLICDCYGMCEYIHTDRFHPSFVWSLIIKLFLQYFGNW